MTAKPAHIFDRDAEWRDLLRFAEDPRAGATLGVVTGRRRQGKTFLLYALAQANESWWSIAHAPKDDEWGNAPPFPRRAANAQQASRARDEAIRYYREVAAAFPGTPEAASALRRLPRLELGLDTGQRRFFCSYC